MTTMHSVKMSCSFFPFFLLIYLMSEGKFRVIVKTRRRVEVSISKEIPKE